ncbi:MAG: LysR substrate-binding domain-containing protein [Devosiaceae bacterium]
MQPQYRASDLRHDGGFEDARLYNRTFFADWCAGTAAVLLAPAPCSNLTMARKCVDEGMGFMIETYPLVADDFCAGRLVHLVSRIRLRPINVYAIYPANSPKDGLAHLFIDFTMDQSWATEHGFGLR